MYVHVFVVSRAISRPGERQVVVSVLLVKLRFRNYSENLVYFLFFENLLVIIFVFFFSSRKSLFIIDYSRRPTPCNPLVKCELLQTVSLILAARSTRFPEMSLE